MTWFTVLKMPNPFGGKWNTLTSDEYYRMDDNNVKFAETYNDAIATPPIAVGIGSTGIDDHSVSLVNPRISVIRNNDLVFDVSDSSLIDYDFKFYYDKELRNEFVSTGTTSIFSVVKDQTIGISSAARFTIKYSDDLPTILYYSFEKDGKIYYNLKWKGCRKIYTEPRDHLMRYIPDMIHEFEK